MGAEPTSQKEDCMKKFLIALVLLPFAAGIASASETLTDQQMDRVTAGGSDSDGQGVSGCALWLEFFSGIRHFNYSFAIAADSSGQNVSTSHSSSSSP
jgi:hypothetical protein